MRLKVERMRMEKRRSGDAKDGAPPNVENGELHNVREQFLVPFVFMGIGRAK